jgi:8-oxo-dGTP pyrophosphatase MutT (NUDIX family)
MAQMYAVFINASKLTFHSAPLTKANDNLFLAGTIPYEQLTQRLELAPFPVHLNVVAEDPKAAFEVFAKGFQCIDAAGGMVLSQGKVLWMRRLNKWDWPKGKLELGEHSTEAALREVAEETGLDQLHITGPGTDTYHTYQLRSGPVLKKTTWYPMESEADGPLKAQVEEGISDLGWYSPLESAALLKNTYPSIAFLWKEWQS